MRDDILSEIAIILVMLLMTWCSILERRIAQLQANQQIWIQMPVESVWSPVPSSGSMNSVHEYRPGDPFP